MKGKVMYSDAEKETVIPRKKDAKYRSCFRRDYGRLVHSPSFRRMVGKTQVFPWAESDFSRNRLTHSIEVAQIAKTLALKFNENVKRDDLRIDTDIVEVAALAHDLGHPPFGHTGEIMLNELMIDHGGFEGNAQTLRILAKIEKKIEEGKEQEFFKSAYGEQEAGLNLTYRSLASVIKYDRVILPKNVKKNKNDKGNLEPIKGYYLSEKHLVDEIKKKVLGKAGKLPTIECAIMDLADDIAYSTYDIEDALKAKFITFADLLFVDSSLAKAIAKKMKKKFKEDYQESDIRGMILRAFEQPLRGIAVSDEIVDTGVQMNSMSSQITNDGRFRTLVTSKLVGRFVRSVDFEINDELPVCSTIRMDKKTKEEIAALKFFIRTKLINSAQFKIYDSRGRYIIEQIFERIDKDPEALLPDDYRERYVRSGKKEQRRVICDHIASMTDRYCAEMYSRLFTENPETIFKPI